MKESHFLHNSRIPFALASAIAAMLATQAAHAIDYFWDTNGTGTAGFGNATGTWGTSAFWSTDSTGANVGPPTVTATTLVGDTVNFGTDSAGYANGGSATVNVSGTQNALNLNFGGATGNITFSGGTVNFSSTTNGSITVNAGSGAINFATTNLVLNRPTTFTNNSTNTLTLGAINCNSRTLTLNGASGAGGFYFGGVIIGSQGASQLTINNSVTVTLGAANTYTGPTLLKTGATLILDTSGQAGGATSVLSLDGGTLQTISTSTKTIANRTYINAPNSFISGTQSITFSGNINSRGGNQTLNNNLASGKTLTMSGNVGLSQIPGGGSLTLSGSGTTNITGVIVDNIADTFAGAVSGAGGTNQLIMNTIGVVNLFGANTYEGATTFRGGGTLGLNYATSNTSKLSDIAALTLGGGTLTLNGASGTHVEVVTSTSLNAGGTFLNRSGNNTAKLRMNAITRAAGATISFGSATLADTDTNNFGASGVNAILGGWATLGNDWAVSANTGAADSAITALASGSYNTTVSGAGSATTNYRLDGTGSLIAPFAAGSLKLTNTGNSQTFNLASNNLTVTSDSATALGGIMYAGGNDNLYTIGNGGGTGRIQTSTANQELIFAVQTGTLSVGAFVGTSGSSGGVTKTGGGTLDISSANNFNGIVHVNQGVLRLSNATASGTSGGGIFVQNGAALELDNGIAVGAELLFITGTGISSGGALRNVASSTASYAGQINISMGDAQINSDSSGALTLSGGIVTAVNRNVTIGGAGNTTVQTSPISGAGNLIKANAGTATLSASNSYTGTTNVNGGTLLINGNSSTATGMVSVNGGTLGGNGTVGGATTVTAAGTLSPGQSPGTLAFANTLGLAGTTIMEIDGNLGAGVTGGHDFVNLTGAGAAGALTYGGTMTLDVGFIFGVGTYSFNLFDFASETNAFTGISFADKYSGSFTNNGSDLWTVSTNSGKESWTFTGATGVLGLTVVPEPGTALLGAIGLLTLLRRRR